MLSDLLSLPLAVFIESIFWFHISWPSSDFEDSLLLGETAESCEGLAVLAAGLDTRIRLAVKDSILDHAAST